MARFCDVLAETGIVTDACLAVGKSTNTAYATRRRNPLFAAAWDAALAIARDRLADTLLARSIEGSLERYYKDGELVGERRIIDSRLGLAILRRLDRLAESGTALPALGRPPAARAIARPEPDWDLALGALRSQDPDQVSQALAMLRPSEAHEAHEAREAREAHDPPNSLNSGDEDPQGGGCWQEYEQWWTDFPPPPGFAGQERGRWGEFNYARRCTAEEEELREALAEVERAEAMREAATRRDEYFASIRAEIDEVIAESDAEPRPNPDDADQDARDAAACAALLAERPPSD